MPSIAADALGAVRERREALRAAMTRLEAALAAPVPGRQEEWAAEVVLATAELVDRFARHVSQTEAPGGLFEDVLARAPRVAHRLDGLRVDHIRIANALDALVRPPLQDPVQIRAAGTAILTELARHRQHGADLMYEAYTVDIGSAD